MSGGSVGVSDDFKLHAVWVGEGEDFFVEAAAGALDEDSVVEKAFFPVIDGGKRDAEGGPGYFASAGEPAGGVRPGKEGKDGAGGSGVVSEIEMVGARVIEVDGALDEAQAENIGIEVQITLRIGGDSGDVVESDDGGW